MHKFIDMYLFPGVLYSLKLLRKQTIDYSLIVIQNSTSKKIAHKLNKSINEGRSNDLYLAKIYLCHLEVIDHTDNQWKNQ